MDRDHENKGERDRKKGGHILKQDLANKQAVQKIKPR